jgi:hypothetical protein
MFARHVHFPQALWETRMEITIKLKTASVTKATQCQMDSAWCAGQAPTSHWTTAMMIANLAALRKTPLVQAQHWTTTMHLTATVSPAGHRPAAVVLSALLVVLVSSRRHPRAMQRAHLVLCIPPAKAQRRLIANATPATIDTQTVNVLPARLALSNHYLATMENAPLVAVASTILSQRRLMHLHV